MVMVRMLVLGEATAQSDVDRAVEQDACYLYISREQVRLLCASWRSPPTLCCTGCTGCETDDMSPSLPNKCTKPFIYRTLSSD